MMRRSRFLLAAATIIAVVLFGVSFYCMVKAYSPVVEALPSPTPVAIVATPAPVPDTPEPVIMQAVAVEEPSVEPEKVIYLTFDDGPCQYTEDVLQLLDEYNAKATFFIIAGRSEYLELLPAIYNAGHCLAIHAYKHDYGLLYTSAESYFEDLEKAQQVVYEYTGSYASVVRFPGGSVTAHAMLREDFPVVEDGLAAMGISYFDWNVQPEDSKNCSAYNTINAFCTKVPTQEIPVVLQHDTRYYSVKSLEAMLKWGTDNGYVFKALDNTVPEVHSLFK